MPSFLPALGVSQSGLCAGHKHGFAFIQKENGGLSQMTTTTAIGDLKKLGSDHLADRRFTLLLDSQEIAPYAAQFQREGVSGVLGLCADGEPLEVWITEYSRPFDLDSNYERVL